MINITLVVRTKKPTFCYITGSILKMKGFIINQFPTSKLSIEMNEIEKYILQYPEDVQGKLSKIRKLIKDNAPEAEELMAYGMPGYKTNKKPLVYFAAFKSHIGFYATPSGHAEFKDELSKYKQGKGSVQFPLNQPIPYELIEQIVKFRVEENNHKTRK